MNSADFLDLLRAKRELTSDRKVAEYLHLNYGHVSQFRTGKREFPDHLAVRVAKELGLPGHYVMFELNAHRAKDSTVKVIWENLAATIKKAHVVAIVVFVGLGTGGAIQSVEAAELSQTPQNGSIIYIMRIRLRRIRNWLRRHLGLPHDALGHGLYSLSILMMIVVAMGTLSGCISSYQHLSDPRIANDGYDLLCGGFEHDIKRVRLSADVCKNVAPNGGEFFHAAIEYRWSK